MITGRNSRDATPSAVYISKSAHRIAEAGLCFKAKRIVPGLSACSAAVLLVFFRSYREGSAPARGRGPRMAVRGPADLLSKCVQPTVATKKHRTERLLKVLRYMNQQGHTLTQRASHKQL